MNTMELSGGCEGSGPEVFVLAEKAIQNKCGRSIESALWEDWAFHEIFGTAAVVTSTLWRLLAEQDIIPQELSIKYLLWTLYFL